MVRPAGPDPWSTSIFVARRFFAALALAASCVTATAVGQPAVEPSSNTPQRVSLQYEEPLACPGQAAFVDAVDARVRRPVEWTQTATLIHMVVKIERAAEHVAGKLEVSRNGAEPTRREFKAATCEEVSSALALVAALALDPNARTEPLLPQAANASKQDFPAPPAPTQIDEPPVAAPPAPPVPPAAPAPPPSPPPRPRDPSHYLAWLGPSVGVAGGYAPEPLISLGLALGARRVVPGLSPGLQLTALWGKTGTTGPAAADGSFAWAVGRLEVCPLQLKLDARLALEPCAAAEAGRLSARGADSQIAEPVTVERWWFAAGATVSLHVTLRHLFFRFAMLGLAPATRDEFVFRDPDRIVHQASPFVYGASLGLGFQFGT
jgi:hypothetical protein